MSEQDSLFDVPTNDWTKEWQDMPEYSNSVLTEPAITVHIHFRHMTDYEAFCHVMQKLLGPQDGKLFDGRQVKTSKTMWFPKHPKGTMYRYDDES